jgi:hypothetical protein
MSYCTHIIGFSLKHLHKKAGAHTPYLTALSASSTTIHHAKSAGGWMTRRMLREMTREDMLTIPRRRLMGTRRGVRVL